MPKLKEFAIIFQILQGIWPGSQSDSIFPFSEAQTNIQEIFIPLIIFVNIDLKSTLQYNLESKAILIQLRLGLGKKSSRES